MLYGGTTVQKTLTQQALAVIRIRLLKRTNLNVEEDEEEDETEDHWMRSVAMDMLHTLKLRGIPDIPRVLIEQDKEYKKKFSPDDKCMSHTHTHTF